MTNTNKTRCAALQFYDKKQLIPLHTWNKKIKNIARGKTPLHTDWPTREYQADDYKTWTRQGLNLGYRIPADTLVIDCDPRNYAENVDTDTQESLAELLGYFDFDEMLKHAPAVKTGGGGYHIYYKLPPNLDPKTLCETLQNAPEFEGIEFKTQGRQVVTAGSRHPSGTLYTWCNETTTKAAPESLIARITRVLRDKNQGARDYVSGAGALTGGQLDELILSKLDILDYANNDKWFPILAGAHHATDGDGVEEFVNWSLQDDHYSSSESAIRARWDSLKDRPSAITVGTLIHELTHTGQETHDLKAVLAFADKALVLDLNDDDFLQKSVAHVANNLDISDIHQANEGAGVKGAAIAAAKKLQSGATLDDKMIVLRLIKAANAAEAIEAQEILRVNKIMSATAITQHLKALQASLLDSLAEMLANKSLEHMFSHGQHITCEPNGQLWVYSGTFWRVISDEYLGKLIYKLLDNLKTKIEMASSEIGLVTNATRAIRIKSSTLNQKIHNAKRILPIINCKNGELWINADGTHALKPHDPKSYLTSCLDVDYTPGAKCPLFNTTILGVFENYKDKKEIVRHVLEIFGYTIQPHKNTQNWFLFRGPGGDGKSTLLKILSGILANAQLQTCVKILSLGSQNSNNHAINSLMGKLAVVVEELPVNYVLNDAGLKMLSENTKMEANPKGKDPFDFNYVGTLFMCTNNYPAIRDTSVGTQRRANVIPFNRQFTQNGTEDIDRAHDILNSKSEMSGFLNLLLESYQRFRKRRKFLPPQSCIEAKKMWFIEANNVVRFADNFITRTSNANILDRAKSVYVNYVAWCSDSGYRPRGVITFNNDLKNLGFRIAKSTGNQLYIYGGAWNSANQFDEF